MSEKEGLIQPHGGYRKLVSFQIGQLIYYITVRFCDLYIDRKSRTCDQMVQAARSCVQNIAEGSQASATSKKTEIKLTNVARASIEELRLDYEDFLRQRGFPILDANHPALMRFKEKGCRTLEEVRTWAEKEKKLGAASQSQKIPEIRPQYKPIPKSSPLHNPSSEINPISPSPSHSQFVTACAAPSFSVPACPCPSLSVPACPSNNLPSSALIANAALSKINLCRRLLDKQIAAQAKSFENEGGFTERMYRIRTERRNQK